MPAPVDIERVSIHQRLRLSLSGRRPTSDDRRAEQPSKRGERYRDEQLKEEADDDSLRRGMPPRPMTGAKSTLGLYGRFLNSAGLAAITVVAPPSSV